ncbi:MAG TPA: A24 family peptidase [Candidatus Ozemobacteraceae bacterium]|nr:A24 family peptidase [Candidatus Ozemobacteraceae bacterium]
MFEITVPQPPDLWLRLIAVTAAAVGMYTDMRRGRIYNWLTFPMIFSGWLLNLYWFGWAGFGYSFLATLAGTGLYLGPAALGIIGMGDVKLLGGMAALAGTRFVVNTFLYSCVLGIPHAVIIQWLNYGKNAVPMLMTSISSGAYKTKTIHNTQGSPGYKFYLGIDLFLGALIATFLEIPIRW